jgi:hypothetical protein
MAVMLMASLELVVLSRGAASRRQSRSLAAGQAVLENGDLSGITSLQRLKLLDVPLLVATLLEERRRANLEPARRNSIILVLRKRRRANSIPT